jgi:hypothetical protein
VYDGIDVSIVSMTIVFINMALIHNVTNKYVNELFKYLDTVLLPRRNMLPRSHYKERNVIKRLGLNYNIIDYYPNRCILYKKENMNLENCPMLNCRLSR